MRHFLLGFTTFLMLTPLLACVMAFCPVKEAKAAEPQHNQTSHCHESKPVEVPEVPMLMFDCLDVDLFSQSTSADYSSDEEIELVKFSWSNITADFTFLPEKTRSIRGPPDYLYTANTYPPIILTTQRFRN